MIALWYTIISFLLVTYVVFDGRNFGIGMLHWLVAKNPAERRQVIAALGPLFSWHEVWLVSFGGTLFATFPQVLASAFSGYYLALFLILWCFILRGMAVEVGGHINDRLWQGFWDFTLVISSFLLAVLFGAAAGNLVRGAPIDVHGNFAMAFFTDFNVKGNVGLLDWYTVSVAILAVVILAAHGATYLTLKTDGPVHDRSASLARKLWLAACPLGLIVTLETVYVRPEIFSQALAHPFSWLGLIVIIGSAIALITGLHRGLEYRAFAGSTALIASVLATGGAAIFPVMLYSTIAPSLSITAYTAASSPGSLLAAIIWWPVAFGLTVAYFVFMTRRYAGKVSAVLGSPDHH